MFKVNNNFDNNIVNFEHISYIFLVFPFLTLYDEKLAAISWSTSTLKRFKVE